MLPSVANYTYRCKVAQPVLREIAQVGPDERLGHLSDAVPELVSLGWLRVVPHSDGDYIEITELGRKWVN